MEMNRAQKISQRYLWAKAQKELKTVVEECSSQPWWGGIAIKMKDKIPYLELRALYRTHELPVSSPGGLKIVSVIRSMPRAL